MPVVELTSPVLVEEKMQQMLRDHPEFSNRLVALTAAAYTLDPREKYDGRTMLFDRAAGVTATLPKATGSGVKLKFVVKTIATSNSHIVKVGNTTDVIQGIVNTIDTDTAGTTTGFAAGASDDTITLNRSTTGSVVKGEWVELEDIASGVWAVKGQLANTGSGATPFSATV